MRYCSRFFRSARTATAGLIWWLAVAGHAADDAWDIGSRRELFLDDALVERLSGRAELRLHQPVPREIAIVHDAPWEGNCSHYHSIFQDGDRYRMYHNTNQVEFAPGTLGEAHPLFCAYAESDDGIHWRKPVLGLHAFQGSKANNIVMVGGTVGDVIVDAGHPAVFKDENPNAAPDARYKALLRSRKPRGLLAYKSSDGIHWAPMASAPIITAGAFDSQNLAFWDSVRGEYRAYWRFFQQGVRSQDDNPAGVRSIRTATSKDFLHWENPRDLAYGDAPAEHLYTNQIKPYHRAPHLFIGFPLRYVDRGWSEATRALPEREHRELRSASVPRTATALTESLLMASRDGVNFKRWDEAFLRPGVEREGTWAYGNHCLSWHVVETKSALKGAPNELSLYATESYWTGNSSALRRFTLRLDGFVSVRAPMSGGEILTRPVRFNGKKLVLNFASSAAGSVRVEIQDRHGKPLAGFALADCPPLFGDSVERGVTWAGGSDVTRVSGEPIRLRFVLEDADLFAFQFVE